ncbi:malto-oligosyltrehalose trehalohydrolase [Spirosoma sordidisoli]|uniref:Malto-oligosyltrehalose trehalohydrolase n=1 Tax=Spirosoma sordidisoli TaxID=2502893 RepID=A0A4Q2UPL3_9BACT|nr:malto-oligosyltrehalose trehalohydrolase [Spirosoma sordidisoli]RYC69560.1 malto-oligosyltrehalose trehalohydrolase [Spirosoma sordidisoli]
MNQSINSAVSVRVGPRTKDARHLYPLTTKRRLLGVSFPADGEADVLVWAPLATQVSICIEQQPDPVPLNKEAYGYWHLRTDQIRPGDRYTFRLRNTDPQKEPDLDGSALEMPDQSEQDLDRPDPASLAQPDGVHGPSQAVDTGSFYWEDQSWVNPPLSSYILYEIHTGSFTPEGTFAALEEKLDYLKSLGINAIEIMPVAQFSGERNWGYDGVYSYAVHNAYGGARALQHLVDACHYRGMAVVLDVVYNHFGPEGNYLTDFGPYLTSLYHTPWGKAVNFDDTWCDGVRRYVIENALMWFRDFHIDALRLDAVHAIKDFSPTHILSELRQQVDALSAQTGRTYYLIVESDLNDPRVISPLAEQGYGMDAQWIDEFHHSLRVSVGEERTGYYADFDRIYHLAKSYIDAYAYDGQFSWVRQKRFGRKLGQHPGYQFIVFSQNHDQVGNRKGGERSSQLFSFDRLKLMAGAVLVSPFIPMLFMGEEWGETNPFFYFVHHSDPELIESVRAGRREEFASFYTGNDMPDPQSGKTFRQTKLQWHLLEQEPHRTLLRYYQHLIALRQQLPALHTLSRRQVAVIPDEDNHTLVLHRWHGDQQVLCLMNFADKPRMIRMPGEGEWQKLFDSADQSWQGPDAQKISKAPATVFSDSGIEVPGESMVLYGQGHEAYHLANPAPMSARLITS